VDPAEGPEVEITLANTFPLATATLQTVREETITEGMPRLAQDLPRMTPQAKAQALSTMAREMTAYARTATEQMQAQAQAYPVNADNFPADTRFGVTQATLTQPKSHPAPANRRRRAPSPTMSEASTAPTLADVNGTEVMFPRRLPEVMRVMFENAAPTQLTQAFQAMEERYRAILNHHTDWNHDQVIAEMLGQSNGAEETSLVSQFNTWKMALANTAAYL